MNTQRKLLFSCIRRLKSTRYNNDGVKRKYEIDPELANQLPIFDYNPKTAPNARVYAWGRTETGALGIKFDTKKGVRSTKQPQRLSFAHLHNVTDITCGYGFTVFAVRSEDGNKIYGCGINTDSQIGYHTIPGKRKHLQYVLLPQPVSLALTNPLETKITDLSAGRAHLLVLTDEGLFTLGNNAYGQCGRSVIEDEKYSGSSIIHKIPEFSSERVKSVHTGQDHSLLVTHQGEVFGCGWGADGQTGLGHYRNTSNFSLIGGDILNENIIKVACKADCVLALNDKGEVFGWGNSEYDQLPHNDTTTQQIHTPRHLKLNQQQVGRIVDIAAGGSFCMVLNTDGEIFVWGYGLLGLGPKVQHTNRPLAIPVNLFGVNSFDPACRVASVACGLSNMMAVNTNGDLYSWGRNSCGNLGLGHNNDQFFPLKVAIGGAVRKVCCSIDHTVTICEAFT